VIARTSQLQCENFKAKFRIAAIFINKPQIWATTFSPENS